VRARAAGAILDWRISLYFIDVGENTGVLGV
jgi:hypothetical protein